MLRKCRYAILGIFLSSLRLAAGTPPLLVFAGAASKPPLEALAQVYERRTGQAVELVFGGSGFVLSQMKLARRGDLYFPGSSDFMELAKREGLVFPETERRVVYLVPAINVQAGNPKNIRTLRDLLRPGLRVAIANPEMVCVGTYAVEILETSLNPDERARFRANLVNYTESCEKTATVLALKAVDAVLGWSVFEHWDPQHIQTVPLDPDQIRRIGYLPVAISTFTQQRSAAQRFLDFVTSPEGRAVFVRHHYFATPEEAQRWIGQPKPVGGEYHVPPTWIPGKR